MFLDYVSSINGILCTALEWADQTLKLMINNPELKYFPVSIVNTLESLVVTHLESGQFETAEKEIGKQDFVIFSTRAIARPKVVSFRFPIP